MTTGEVLGRRWLYGAFMALALKGSLLATPQNTQHAAASSVTIQRVAVPSYFYPGKYWTQLVDGAPCVGMAIVSPGDGPGLVWDPNYLNETKRAQSKGIIILGYVYTRYSSRPAGEIQKEIDQYDTWYGVDGIFVDEVSTDCAQHPYYQALHDYIKNRGGRAKVVINPGTDTPECYAAAADVIVTFEDNYAAYLNWRPRGWEVNYPADRFWHLVIGTNQADMPAALALSKQRNAGWIYITNDNQPNPWDTLPSNPYWSDLLKALAGVNRIFLPLIFNVR